MTTRATSRRTGTFTAVATIAGAIGFAALIVLAWRFAWFDYGRAGRFARSLRALNDPALAAAIFVAGWGIAGSLGFPALPLMICGGVLFGTLLGTALSLVGTAIGASGGYAIARFLTPGWFHRWLEKHVPVRELSDRHGFIAVVRFRLLPVVPLAVGNVAAGLARIDYGRYLAGTLVGQLPSTAIYTYFGDALTRAAAAGTRAAAERDVFVASAVFLLISIAPRIIQRFMR